MLLLNINEEEEHFLSGYLSAIDGVIGAFEPETAANWDIKGIYWKREFESIVVIIKHSLDADVEFLSRFSKILGDRFIHHFHSALAKASVNFNIFNKFRNKLPNILTSAKKEEEKENSRHFQGPISSNDGIFKVKILNYPEDPPYDAVIDPSAEISFIPQSITKKGVINTGAVMVKTYTGIHNYETGYFVIRLGKYEISLTAIIGEIETIVLGKDFLANMEYRYNGKTRNVSLYFI